MRRLTGAGAGRNGTAFAPGAGMQRIDRLSPTQPPPEPSILRQSWRDLLFLHWSVDPEVLRPLVPGRLDLDLFGGRAWVALTPFHLTGVRPRLLPPLPLVSRFGEVNVRTYVHLGGRDPGVWFLSLDASSRLAAMAARFTYRLPYHTASIRFESSAGRHRFSARRDGGGRCDVVWDVAESAEPWRAKPGTLDAFLVERYVLYAEDGGRLLRARVHHEPYPLLRARLVSLEEDLAARAGIALPRGQRPVAHFSPGVDVDVFAPHEVSHEVAPEVAREVGQAPAGGPGARRGAPLA